MSSYYASVIKQVKRQGLEIDITNSIAFRGIIGAFPDVAQRVNDKFGKNYTVENFDDINKEIYDKVRQASLRSSSNSVKAYTSVIQNAMRPRSIF